MIEFKIVKNTKNTKQLLECMMDVELVNFYLWDSIDFEDYLIKIETGDLSDYYTINLLCRETER